MSAKSIDIVIYFYIFICLALMAYNIIYVMRSKRMARRHFRREHQWEDELCREWECVERGEGISREHQQRMKRKLRKIEQLMAYHEFITGAAEHYPRTMIQQYLDECVFAFQALAVDYGKRPAMERAYFAELMAIYHPARDRENGRLVQILLGYLEDSTIFCRENVLQALYAMGKPGAIEHALELLNDRGWYHSPRLLSDGLASFYGDREELALRLWHRCKAWNETLQVAVVQFITAVSDLLAGELLDALKDGSLYLEARFAVVRYFQRRVYPPAKEALLGLLEHEDRSGLPIAAAAALVRYPGPDTFQALMQAVRDRNYHVRRNAAASLAGLGATREHVRLLLEAGDRYAAEMLDYTLREQAPLPNTAAVEHEKEVVRV